MLKPFIFLIFFSTSLLIAQPKDTSKWDHSIEIQVKPGIQTTLLNGEFGLDTLDNFGGNWKAMSIDAEYAHDWEGKDPFVYFTINEKYSSYFEVFLEYGIKKDLEAFQDQSIAHNTVYNPNEMDINLSFENWISLKNDLLGMKVGRQALSYGPSKSRGVAFSGAPYHDAIETSIQFPHVTYYMTFTAINPYLGGTPIQSSSPNAVDQFPIGSEEYQQRQHGSVPNQHRIYDEPYKHVAYHRLDISIGLARIGLVEQLVIGGKYPDLRDINPMLYWHNNYGDGFSNSITSLDLALNFKSVGSFYIEVALDDVQYGDAEKGGNPAVFAALAGWNHTFSIYNGNLKVLFEAIYTDPLYGNSKLPLLKHTNRTVYKSNYRSREEPSFVDTFVVDYPVGYYRGPDKLDFWLDVEYQKETRKYGLELAYLQSGDKTLYSEYYGSNGPKWALSGSTTREIRSQCYIKSPLYSKFNGNLAMLYRYFPWEDQANDLQFSLGISRTFTIID